MRQKCLPVLRKFNFSWPAPLDCSRLPMPGDDAMCMEVPSINSSSSSSGSSHTATTSQHHPDPRPYPDHTRTPSQSLVRLDCWNANTLAIVICQLFYIRQFLPTHVVILSPFCLSDLHLVTRIIVSFNHPSPPFYHSVASSTVLHIFARSFSLYPPFLLLLTPTQDPGVSVCPPRQTWVGVRGGGTCVGRCHQDILFRRSDKHFAEVCMPLGTIEL